MDTLRLDTSYISIQQAGEIIRDGGLVAFPTETVYGLGADALNGEAVKSVYAAKGRPSDNPMIVHIAETSQLADLVSEIPAVAVKLIGEFWPGPITFVFKKMPGVPNETTGGLDTVAIRMPSNETARRLIKASDRPIAAPSANLSGKPSPTTYGDVLEDMDGRIDAVIEGEDCTVGIESTVVDLTGDVPTILRPGFVTREMLEDATGMVVEYDAALMQKPDDEDFHPKSPGMKYKHYSPKAEVRIVTGSDTSVTAKLEELRKAAIREGRATAVLDYGQDSAAAAKDFFARLRECDRDGVELILVRGLAENELGFSVMNRMLKSAGYDVVHV